MHDLVVQSKKKKKYKPNLKISVPIPSTVFHTKLVRVINTLISVYNMYKYDIISKALCNAIWK